MANGNDTGVVNPSEQYAASVASGTYEFTNPVGGAWNKLKAGASNLGSKLRTALSNTRVGSFVVKGFDLLKSGVHKAKEAVSNWFGINQQRSAEVDGLLGIENQSAQPAQDSQQISM